MRQDKDALEGQVLETKLALEKVREAEGAARIRNDLLVSEMEVLNRNMKLGEEKRGELEQRNRELELQDARSRENLATTKEMVDMLQRGQADWCVDQMRC